ncbi:hypothetical protein HY412_01445 [Candidatus Kaiserbacteria bacterium]|nr:hypothetical protein [Candidatus Kaiserbacteria bacterium]
MTFKQFIGSGDVGIIGIINTVIVPVIFAFAFVVFIWGIVKYFFISGDDETKRSDGRQFAFWGILGMVVLLSVWGFVNLLLSTLGIMPRA